MPEPIAPSPQIITFTLFIPVLLSLCRSIRLIYLADCRLIRRRAFAASGGYPGVCNILFDFNYASFVPDRISSNIIENATTPSAKRALRLLNFCTRRKFFCGGSVF
jgi:hypothetical protein